MIDLEDLILNYNHGTSGERVIGVKKRRIGEGVRTPFSLALYPSAHHDSSPLLEVLPGEEDRLERSMLLGRRNNHRKEVAAWCA